MSKFVERFLRNKEDNKNNKTTTTATKKTTTRKHSDKKRKRGGGMSYGGNSGGCRQWGGAPGRPSGRRRPLKVQGVSTNTSVCLQQRYSAVAPPVTSPLRSELRSFIKIIDSFCCCFFPFSFCSTSSSSDRSVLDKPAPPEGMTHCRNDIGGFFLLFLLINHRKKVTN